MAELCARLMRRGVGEAEARSLVERLREVGLLDDRAYARTYVSARERERGATGLRHELRRKGVDEAVVDEALAERDDDAEGRAAAALLVKHAWRFRGDDRAERRAAAARAFAMLARRGFAPDAARHAVEQVLGPIEDG